MREGGSIPLKRRPYRFIAHFSSLDSIGTPEEDLEEVEGR